MALEMPTAASMKARSWHSARNADRKTSICTSGMVGVRIVSRGERARMSVFSLPHEITLADVPAVLSARSALGWFAVVAVIAICWLALPFATGILLGTLMAFTLDPVYTAIVRWTKRPAAASVITIAASTLLILGALSAFVTQFVTRTVALANTVRAQLHDHGPLSTWLDTGTSWLGRFGISTA